MWLLYSMALFHLYLTEPTVCKLLRYNREGNTVVRGIYYIGIANTMTSLIPNIILLLDNLGKRSWSSSDVDSSLPDSLNCL